jgi:iron complex transport system permease protein
VNASPWLVLRGARASLKFDRRVPAIAVALLAATIGLMIWNVGTGEYPIPAIDVLRTLLGLPTGSEKDFSFVVNTLRTPRALVGWTVGVMLALAGSVLQTLTRNALASPDITGVTAGAGLGTVILIVALGGAAPVSLPAGALIGGLSVAALIYALAWRGGDSPLRLVLVGVGLGSVLGAAQTLLLLRAPPEVAQRALLWLTGSIYARSWEHLFALLPWCAVLVPLVLLSSARLNVISLGEDIARGLGVRMQLQRAALLLAAVGLTGAAVSQVGALGFVGLIAPHVARRLVGPAHEGNLFVSGLIGGLIVAMSDFVGRAAFAPTEVPAGIITALIGAPFFMYLLWRGR